MFSYFMQTGSDLASHIGASEFAPGFCSCYVSFRPQHSSALFPGPRSSEWVDVLWNQTCYNHTTIT